MGKPSRVPTRLSRTEYIGVWRQTRGTETSQYPKEEKSTEIPLVAASERGLAQTDGKKFLSGLWDLNVRLRGVIEGPGKVSRRG